jgi:hypothetical protein
MLNYHFSERWTRLLLTWEIEEVRELARDFTDQQGHEWNVDAFTFMAEVCYDIPQGLAAFCLAHSQPKKDLSPDVSTPPLEADLREDVQENNLAATKAAGEEKISGNETTLIEWGDKICILLDGGETPDLYKGLEECDQYLEAIGSRDSPTLIVSCGRLLCKKGMTLSRIGNLDSALSAFREVATRLGATLLPEAVEIVEEARLRTRFLERLQGISTAVNLQRREIGQHGDLLLDVSSSARRLRHTVFFGGSLAGLATTTIWLEAPLSIPLLFRCVIQVIILLGCLTINIPRFYLLEAARASVQSDIYFIRKRLENGRKSNRMAVKVLNEHRVDAAPFVLFLRSFELMASSHEVDAEEIEPFYRPIATPDGRPQRVVFTRYTPSGERVEKPLGEALSGRVSILGIGNEAEISPFIDHAVPMLHPKKGSWVKCADLLIEAASLIVLEISSFTPGVCLELDMLKARERQDSTVIILTPPPARDDFIDAVLKVDPPQSDLATPADERFSGFSKIIDVNDIDFNHLDDSPPFGPLLQGIDNIKSMSPLDRMRHMTG